MTRVHRLRDFTDTSACDPPILSLRTSFPIHRRLVSGLNRRFPFVVYGAGSSINAPLPQIEQNALAKNSQHAMNLLNHLWDDTVAGPPPEDGGGGLGKLRKFSTFNSRPDSRNESENPNQRSLTVDTADDGMKVTRSIKILKSPRNQSKDSPPSSPSPSPAGSTPPVSPFSFSGLGGREAYRFRRKSAYENARGIGPRSPPPPYDITGMRKVETLKREKRKRFIWRLLTIYVTNFFRHIRAAPPKKNYKWRRGGGREFLAKSPRQK